MQKLGYGRVSSPSQAERSHAASQQRRRLDAAGCSEIFFDVLSGEDDDRPDFEALMKRVSQRDRCDCVTITQDDRMARHGIMSLSVLEVFISSGCQLEILDAGGLQDLLNPYVWKMRADAGISAEFENKVRRMKIKKGFEDFRAEGRANPKPPFGYLRVDDRYQRDLRPWPSGGTHLDIAIYTIEAYLLIQTLQGACQAVDKKFGKVWSMSGLRGWLHNPTLRGHTPYGRSTKARAAWTDIRYDTHPTESIMSEETYRQICDLLAANGKQWGANRKARNYPLSGLAVCGGCSKKMTHMTSTKANGRIYLYCPQRSHKNVSKPCDQKSTPRVEPIEAAVIEALRTRSVEIAAMADMPDEIIESAELTALRSELATLTAFPNQSRVALAISEVEAQIKAKYRQLQIDANQYSSGQQQLQQVFSSPQYWESLSNIEKQQLYRALVSRVVVKDGAIERIDLKV